jgi:KipI family sensor histidine kinase inhibitor
MWPNARIKDLGDQALLVELGEVIDPALNARVHALAAQLRKLPEALEVVPAFASVAVWVADPALLTADLRTRITQLLEAPLAHSAPGAFATHDIEVDFDAGEDLSEAATTLGLSIPALIERLCAPRYQVAMLGFLPGFPYLLGLDPALALPRRSSPRLRVPAGSLAIGGAQLGIYPCCSPGGWHLLGHVQVPLFDAARDRPALLGPGEFLRLRPA